MTFKEMESVCNKVTCGKMRCRAEKVGHKYLKIVTWINAHNKDYEFINSGHLFTLTDEKILPLSQLADMDLNSSVEMIKNMMFSLHIHEFQEYFKFDKVTVQSPHLMLKNYE